MNNTTINTINELLNSAGITVNGSNPWDINIHNQDFYARVVKQGSLGLGEAYMDKWWDCQALDQFFERVISANLPAKIISNKRMLLNLLMYKLINFQNKKRSIVVAEQHYNLGNDLFEVMLDKRMNYTCGYWQQANNLDDAQLDKLELSCQKLMLEPGMRLLDIGCGFGALAKYAASKYKVNVVGVTNSKEQSLYAKQNCQGLPIEIILQDYRDVRGKFDRIVSLGMFEHVGQKNYPTYMQIVNECLKENGIFLLHTIGSNISQFSCDEWIAKYIFPNGMLPSITQIGKASEQHFKMEDWHNFGADYDKTLMAWYHNVDRHWQQLNNKYDERFHRMWRYYLLSCAGAFRTRDIQLWQIVFSKQGVRGGYVAPRLLYQDDSLVVANE